MPDNNNYPTDDELEAIRGYSGTIDGFLEVVQAAWPGDFGTITETRFGEEDRTEVRFVTGGWSGCEDIVGLVKQSMFSMLFWQSSARGGMHVFVVPDAQRSLPLVALGLAAEPSAVTYTEADMTEVMTERDQVIDWADRLAYAIAPVSVIGEHSSANNPWRNALDHLDVRPDREPTDEQKKAVALAILMVTQGDIDPEYAWRAQFEEVQEELLAQARVAIIATRGLAG